MGTRYDYIFYRTEMRRTAETADMAQNRLLVEKLTTCKKSPNTLSKVFSIRHICGYHLWSFSHPVKGPMLNSFFC